MSECVFCHKSIPSIYDPGLDANLNHEMCRLESKQRSDAGKCVKCGKNDAGDRDLRCFNCEHNNLDYDGYKGPQS